MSKQICYAMVSAALAASLIACGDDDDDAVVTPDAAAPVADAALTADAPPPPVDADLTPDAFMTMQMPSCDEFTTPASTISAYPGTFTGDIGAAGANLNVDACTESSVSPFFGVVAPGPDQVIKLTGMTPGTRYFARADSEGDLAVYVLTGCMSGTATVEQCLNFTDIGVGGVESASFIAPAGGEAYAIVDYYDDASLPSATSYTFTIDTTGCLDDLGCPAATPLCSTGSNTCGGPIEVCTGDDAAAEAASDDGPSGATVLNPTIVTPSVTNAGACTSGGVDPDWYKINTVVGDKLTASLAWADAAADMDIYAFDAQLNLIGQSWWENPETVALSFLASGTVYLRVERYTPDDDPAVTPYTLTVTRAAPALCTTVADCAADFRNQNFRGNCTAGACQFIAGAGAVAQGGSCDSTDDCTEAAGGTICTAFPFNANLDTHGKCSTACTTDAECQLFLGADGRCTTGGGTNYCHVKCTADNQCETRFNDMPLAGQPWAFAACTIATGACNIQ